MRRDLAGWVVLVLTSNLCFPGRRNMQTRLIEPCQKSLNSGDCFVLVTKDDLFAWVGKDANAIERAKVSSLLLLAFNQLLKVLESHYLLQMTGKHCPPCATKQRVFF